MKNFMKRLFTSSSEYNFKIISYFGSKSTSKETDQIIKVHKKPKLIEKESSEKVQPSKHHRIIHSPQIEGEVAPVSKDEDECCEDDIVSPTLYNPSKEDYHPIKDACWRKGEKVPFKALCRTFSYIEETSARLKMISILSNYYHSVIRLNPSDLVPSIYMTLNQTFPNYEGKELGIGESSLIAVLADATGKKVDEIKKGVSTYADLGVVAEKFKTTQHTILKHKPLFVAEVFNKLKELTDISGHNANQMKKSKIMGLLTASSASESKYLIRSLLKKLRIGLAEQSIIVAVAHAFVCSQAPLKHVPPKQELDSAALILKTAYCELPNYDTLIPALLDNGLEEIQKSCGMQVGIPVKPMLAVSSKSVAEILKRFQDQQICCEFKYDGERAQIHCDNSGVVKIFSRNQENSTVKFPDLVQMASKVGVNATSFIIDSEVVAWDCESSRILPFQVLTTRKRKNVLEGEIKIRVCVFAFDLLLLNGDPLVCRTLRERRLLLHQNFQEIPGQFMFAKSQEVDGADGIQQLFEESIKANCEGLIIKTLDISATYEIAKRSHSWRKFKKDYLDTISDSFDLVVIGGYLGAGKRSGTYGGYLLACYDPDEEEFQTICKIGTGFSDEDLKEQYSYFSELIIPSPKASYRYFDNLKPDHWFDSKIVWEVKAADISLSPVHQAAFGKIADGKGVSLRFPRYQRLRTDKSPEQATDLYQIVEMYKKQQNDDDEPHKIDPASSDF